jgi:hypothetical protein
VSTEITPFQAALEAALRDRLAVGGRQLSASRVEYDWRDASTTLVAAVEGTPVRVWLYADGASLEAAGATRTFEALDFADAGTLTRALLAAVEAALRESAV